MIKGSIMPTVFVCLSICFAVNTVMKYPAAMLTKWLTVAFQTTRATTIKVKMVSDGPNLHQDFLALVKYEKKRTFISLFVG